MISRRKFLAGAIAAAVAPSAISEIDCYRIVRGFEQHTGPVFFQSRYFWFSRVSNSLHFSAPGDVSSWKSVALPDNYFSLNMTMSAE